MRQLVLRNPGQGFSGTDFRAMKCANGLHVRVPAPPPAKNAYAFRMTFDPLHFKPGP
jgi:hypothetical protein